MDRSDRPRVPAIMLSDAAVALLRDAFGKPDLFAGYPRIGRRVVAWGPKAEANVLPHSAIVVSETQLLGALSSGVEGVVSAQSLTIYTSPPFPPETEEHRFGSRRAVGLSVRLKHGEDANTCWVESVQNGWLFLIPDGFDSAWLLAIGGSPEALLSESRVVSERIERMAEMSGDFPTAPRIVSPLYGDGWIACGAAAIGFDPICGDGTANAVREAILGSAVIRAIIGGGDATSLLQYYDARLTAGMLRHVDLCAEYYRTGGAYPWWRRESEALEAGRRWCMEKLKGVGEPRYQLRGLVLEPR